MTTNACIEELEYNPDLDDNHVHTDSDVYGDIEQELENLLKNHGCARHGILTLGFTGSSQSYDGTKPIPDIRMNFTGS